MRYGTIVARLRNHCCNVNVPLPSVCVCVLLTYIDSVNNTTILNIIQ